MSDAAKNVEIEDVLASIRRLVSEEPQAQKTAEQETEESVSEAQPETAAEAPDAQSQAEVAEPAGFDALVLTQAQRVAEDIAQQDISETATEAGTADTSDENTTDVAQDASVSAEEHDDALLEADPQTEMLRAVSQIVAIDEELEESMVEAERRAEREEGDAGQDTDAAESVEVQTPASVDDTIVRDQPGDEQGTNDDAETVEEASVVAPADDEAEPAQALETKIANLEALVEKQGGGWEGEGHDAPQEILLQPEADLDRELQAEREAEEAAAKEAEASATEDVAEAQGDVADDAVQEPESEDAVDAMQDDSEGYTAPVEADAETALSDTPLEAPEAELPDPAEDLEVISAPKEVFVSTREVPPLEAAADPADAADDISEELEILSEASDDLIDEDMLRDMVSAIVREELQGELGERITRNVRKLVRREIHRALASHDID